MNRKGKQYLLDKRVLKQNFKKYIVVFVFVFPLLILLNIFALKGLSGWLMILIDLAIALVLGIIIFKLIDRIVESKKLKRESEEFKSDKIYQNEKEKILKESYVRIRQEKLKAKAQKLKEDNLNEKK